MDHLNSATDDFDFLDDDVSEMNDEMEEFEDDDDVQAVWHNMNLSDAMTEAMG
jgi:transcriptional/translational regulatory protein YebC/TACO1